LGRWALKELLAGDTDDLTRCPADLAPGDGLLPAEDNLFPMGRSIVLIDSLNMVVQFYFISMC
jgi:hypothetical protein